MTRSGRCCRSANAARCQSITINVVSDEQNTTSPDRPARGNRKVIHATCSTHGAARGFTNLVVSKSDGTIVFDPHVTGQCLLTLSEDEACALRDVLIEWLG